MIIKHNNQITAVILSSLLLTLAGCGAIGTGEEIETVELNARASPSEGGSANPETGTYETGEEITVEAVAADGWKFSEWAGTIESTENPLQFTITENTSLTAHFTGQSKAHSQTLAVSDGVNSRVLEFGIKQEATEGYDGELENEAPPAPPEGSFYTHFTIPDYNLFADYRPVSGEQTVWELNFAPEESRSITLEWNIDADSFTGMLTMTDDPENPTVEMNMAEESSYQPGSMGTLFIIQK